MGYGNIEGVQGRYFTPLLLIPLISMRSNRVTVEPGVNRTIMMLIPVAEAMLFSCLIIRA